MVIVINDAGHITAFKTSPIAGATAGPSKVPPESAMPSTELSASPPVPPKP
jgi:hypothetical protein